METLWKLNFPTLVACSETIWRMKQLGVGPGMELQMPAGAGLLLGLVVLYNRA